MSDLVSPKNEEFFSSFRKQVFKKGELLIRADDEPTGIFYLRSGRVKMYAISKKGEEMILTIYKPGSFFPMTWALNRTINRYYYEAIEEAEVSKAPVEKVLSYLEENPEVLLNLMKRVYRGVDGILTRMALLMGGTARGRIIYEILINVERFGTHSENQATLSISEIQLARETGLTRETISREIKLLKEKGIVTFAKNVLHVPDLKKLQEGLDDV